MDSQRLNQRIDRLEERFSRMQTDTSARFEQLQWSFFAALGAVVLIIWILLLILLTSIFRDLGRLQGGRAASFRSVQELEDAAGERAEEPEARMAPMMEMDADTGRSEQAAEAAGSGADALRCDFCGETVPYVRRVALDRGYDRLKTPHRVRYACPRCSEEKERSRLAGG